MSLAVDVIGRLVRTGIRNPVNKSSLLYTRNGPEFDSIRYLGHPRVRSAFVISVHCVSNFGGSERRRFSPNLRRVGGKPYATPMLRSRYVRGTFISWF